MFKPLIHFFLALPVLLLAAACSPAPEPLSAPTGSSPTQPTSAGLPLPTNTAPAPSSLEEQTASVPSPTAQIKPDLSTYRVEAWQNRSPDGRWQVNIIVDWPPLEDTGESQPLYRVRVRLVKLSFGHTTELVDEWRPYGLGLDLPTVLQWEADGSALYLSNSGTPDGCGAPFYSGLKRVELPSLNVQELALNVNGRPALLPGGTRLLAFDAQGLSVLSMGSGAAVHIPVELPDGDWHPGSILISPDANQALFTVVENPCGGPALGWLGMIDLRENRAQTLLRSDERVLRLLSWPLPELAQLRSAAGEDAWFYLEHAELRSEPPAEPGLASAALVGFFEALSQGNYGAAVEYYAGSYELQRDHNPSIAPEDLAGLWQNACTINGAQCLPVLSAVLESRPAPGEYRFMVQFALNGELYRQGPCCGGAIEEFPPASEFLYTVRKDASGKYQVMDLPVYEP